MKTRFALAFLLGSTILGPALASAEECRALEVSDPKKVIERADDKLVTKCVRLLMDKLRKVWCTADNKGKTFEYIFDPDHKVGTGKFAKKLEAKKQKLTCFTVAK